MLRAAGECLVYGALWIACCATSLSVESTLVLRQPVPAWPVLGFVFFSTLCHYNLHYWFRERQLDYSLRDQWSQRRQWWYGPIILFSAGGALYCLRWLTLSEILMVVVLGVLSLWYSLPWLPRSWRLKQQGIVKPFVLAGVWTMTTVWLPTHDAEPALLGLVMARRFVFMLTLCLAFDVRDQTKDERAGIRTIPVRVGNTVTYRMMDILLVCFVLFAIGVEWHLQRYGLLVALCLSAIVTKIAIRATGRYTSELYYLGVIDGMMIVQAALVWLAVGWNGG